MLLVTSQGVGAMWRLCGLQRDLFQNSKFSTLAFVGDALKANHTAFALEAAALSAVTRTPNAPIHLAIQLDCCIHQLCLVRRPAVLHVAGLWSCIVRLSHLFDTASFRTDIVSSGWRLLAFHQEQGKVVYISFSGVYDTIW